MANLDQNLDKFSRSILFLNSIYYREKVLPDYNFKKRLLKQYSEIYVSSIVPVADADFPQSKMLPCSELGGSMALGRVLYNLLLRGGRFSCVVEGYDQYLKSNAYSSFYPTLIRENDVIDELKVVQSLADHDPLYNFLIVKELSRHLNFLESKEFG